MFVDKNILFIWAHFDDIELSCWWTIAKISLEYPTCTIYYCICATSTEDYEVRSNEQKEVWEMVNVHKIYELWFNDWKLTHNKRLISSIEEVISEVNPSIIFTHAKEQSHQDHIAVYNATITSCRNFNWILVTYPSYRTNLLDAPTINLFIDISKYMNEKTLLLKKYVSQQWKKFMDETFVTSYNQYYWRKFWKEFIEPFYVLQHVI